MDNFESAAFAICRKGVLAFLVDLRSAGLITDYDGRRIKNDCRIRAVSYRGYRAPRDVKAVSSIAPKYQRVAGLIRKYFLL